MKKTIKRKGVKKILTTIRHTRMKRMKTKMKMKMRTPAVQISRCWRSKLPQPEKLLALRLQPEKVGRVGRVASLCFPLEVHFTRMAGMAKVAVAKTKKSQRNLAKVAKVAVAKAKKKNLARA